MRVRLYLIWAIRVRKSLMSIMIILRCLLSTSHLLEVTTRKMKQEPTPNPAPRRKIS